MGEEEWFRSSIEEISAGKVDQVDWAAFWLIRYY